MSFKDKLSSFLFHPKKEELPEEALPEELERTAQEIRRFRKR